MSDKLKNILIGFFTIMAISTTIMIILFLKPSIGDGKKTLNVRFSNIAGINIGTRVCFAGRPVGEVESIIEVPNARGEKKDELGRFYYYQLKLKVDSSIDIYNSDVIAIQTTGLMGEKSIGITPKAAKKNQELQLITDEIIFAQSIDSLENTVYQFTDLADKIEKTFTNANNWFEKNQNSLSNIISSLSRVIGSADNLNIVESTKASLDNFAESMNNVNISLTELKDADAIAKFNYLLENLAMTSEFVNKEGKDIFKNIDAITTDLKDATGTIGKLINNDDLYLRVNSLMSKADVLMNDINHYGVLFQYDKHWQRLRMKRANQMQALNNPKKFKEYFETELDGINTSLARITTIIDRAKNDNEKEKIINSNNFKKDFANLLRDVDSLRNNLKLYNQEIFNPNAQ